MKVMTRKNKINILKTAAFFCVIIFSGCNNHLLDPALISIDETLSSSQGKVTLSFSLPNTVLLPDAISQPQQTDTRADRSLMPTSPSAFDHFKLTFTDTATENPNPQITETLGTTGGTLTLPVGTWAIVADGYITSTVRGATATDTIIITENTTASKTITLSALPISSIEPGTFSWNINATGITDGASSGFSTLSTALITIGVTSYNLKTDPSGNLPNLLPGAYDISIRLTKPNGMSAGYYTKAYIYPGLTTRAAGANFTFTDADFAETLMLAGTLTISKPDDLVLSGTPITLNAYSDAERTTANQIGTTTVAHPTFTGSPRETGTTGEWVLPVTMPAEWTGPVDRRVYFTAAVTDGANSSTANAGDTGVGGIPDNGMENISLSMDLYTTMINLESGGSIASKPFAAFGETVTITVSHASGYKLKPGTLRVKNLTDTTDLVIKGDGTVLDPYTFVMPASEVELSAEYVLDGTDVYVSSTGVIPAGDEYGLGTITNPVTTVAKALEIITASGASAGTHFTIHVAGTITDASGMTNNAMVAITNASNPQNYPITIQGKGTGGDAGILDNETVTGRRVLYITNGARITLGDNLTLTNGKAGTTGGGIYMTGNAEVTLDGATISGNSATGTTGNSAGGGVFVDSGIFRFENGTISNNTVPTVNRFGGGIFVTTGATAILNGGIISDNSAHNGGGIANAGALSIPIGSTVNIKDNIATCGAGIFITATGESPGGTVTMSAGTIEQNKAIGAGGGVYVSYGNLNMQGGIIRSNINTPTPTTMGGGVFVAADGIVNMTGGTIGGSAASDKNEAADGGGVYIFGSFTMGAGGSIKGNNATDSGGGVYVEPGATFNLQGGIIGGVTGADKNAAAFSGGGVFNEGTFNMYSGSIAWNSSDGFGGGIITSANTFNMEGGTINNNTADTGGGVYHSDGSFTMSGSSTITHNAATTTGDGVEVATTTGTFTMSGGAAVDVNNVVYLPTGKVITIGDSGVSSHPAAKIEPQAYTATTPVLGGTTGPAGTITDNYTKFELTSFGWTIDSEGKLQASTTTGVEYSISRVDESPSSENTVGIEFSFASDPDDAASTPLELTDIVFDPGTTGAIPGPLTGSGTIRTLTLSGITNTGIINLYINKTNIDSELKTLTVYHIVDTAPGTIYAQIDGTGTQYTPIETISADRLNYTIVVPPPNITDAVSVQLTAVPRDTGSGVLINYEESSNAITSDSRSGTYRPNKDKTFMITSGGVTGPVYTVTVVWAKPVGDTSGDIVCEDLTTMASGLADDYFLVGDYTASLNWLPVGKTGYPFTGTLRGKGDLITLGSFEKVGLLDDNYYGLFGYTNGAQIEEIRVDMTAPTPSGLTAATDAGVIAGHAVNTTISRVSTSGSLAIATGLQINIGGIAGSFDGGTISNVSGNVTINGNNATIGTNAGGLAGLLSNGTITKSSASGTVIGKNDISGAVYVGGIIGNIDVGSVTYCVAQNQSLSATGLLGTKAANRIVGKKGTGTINIGTNYGRNGMGGTTSSTAELNGVTKNSLTDDPPELGQQATYEALGWDFTTIWEIIGTNYPTLR